MEEIGPTVPLTVILDWALGPLLSGTAIAAGLEKTVSGISGEGDSRRTSVSDEGRFS